MRPRPRWVLASASPRRKRLARLFGVPFAVRPATVAEARSGSPARMALASARRKARHVAREFPGTPVVACDTVVCVGGKTLGKPRSWIQAHEMLRLLSGRDHQVWTGAWMVGADGTEAGAIVRSLVWFRALSGREIPGLARRMGSLDKAGGYAAQGRVSPVRRIRGSISNVLGLPLARVGRLLVRERLLSPRGLATALRQGPLNPRRFGPGACP